MLTLEERILHMERDLADLRSKVDSLRPERGRSSAVESSGKNPWIEAAGMFRDDPLFDEWQRAIAEYRREVDRRAETP